MLDVRGLEIGFAGDRAPVLAGLDLLIGDGETVALVGESGSGKSLTALSIMRLLPRGGAVRAGSIVFDGQDVLAMAPGRLNRLRGSEIAMLFQQPRAMLDPSATAGSQVAEAVRLHTGLSGKATAARVIALLREVGIPAPEARARCYAHQLSSGMAQRVMIAAALAGNPRLLIADEPTAALDVTVQLQILRLLARERESRHLATLLITHDLGVVAALADRVLVLYAGRVVEEGTRREILERPQHPYTRALVRASLLRPQADGSVFAVGGSAGEGAVSAQGCRFLPRCDTATALGIHEQCGRQEPQLLEHGAPGHRVRCHAPGERDAPAAAAAPLARAVRTENVIAALRGVSKHYPFGRRGVVRALDGMDLAIREGEALGLVGESGCGKSTLARVLLRMTQATSGDVEVMGYDGARLGAGETRQLHRDVQLVFQDPVGALDPRMCLGDSLLAALASDRRGTAATRRAAVLATMRDVGLGETFYDRLPRECSGGQLQRAVIARALLMRPRLLVCDEPTSALDALIRAQILNLLGGLRASRDLTMLMISHDLRVVRHLCNRVAVMYLGEIVELAETEQLFARPAHPYTQALIAASSLEEHGLACSMGWVQGEPPSPLEPQAGCRFHARCRLADARCAAEHPALAAVMPGHDARCWHWRDALAGHVGGGRDGARP